MSTPDSTSRPTRRDTAPSRWWLYLPATGGITVGLALVGIPWYGFRVIAVEWLGAFQWWPAIPLAIAGGYATAVLIRFRLTGDHARSPGSLATTLVAALAITALLLAAWGSERSLAWCALFLGVALVASVCLVWSAYGVLEAWCWFREALDRLIADAAKDGTLLRLAVSSRAAREGWKATRARASRSETFFLDMFVPDRAWASPYTLRVVEREYAMAATRVAMLLGNPAQLAKELSVFGTLAETLLALSTLDRPACPAGSMPRGAGLQIWRDVTIACLWLEQRPNDAPAALRAKAFEVRQRVAQQVQASAGRELNSTGWMLLRHLEATACDAGAEKRWASLIRRTARRFEGLVRHASAETARERLAVWGRAAAEMWDALTPHVPAEPRFRVWWAMMRRVEVSAPRSGGVFPGLSPASECAAVELSRLYKELESRMTNRIPESWSSGLAGRSRFAAEGIDRFLLLRFITDYAESSSALQPEIPRAVEAPGSPAASERAGLAALLHGL